MSHQRIQLQHPDGTPWKRVGESELRSMQDKGYVTRVSPRRDVVQVYRMRSLADPSTAKASASCITIHDTRAMAGMTKINEVWIERLIGFNLLPEGAMVPASGYLA
jgi:hypothetical protein